MIYTKSNTFLENCYKSLEKARDEYSSINENAYAFLYESEYNLNCMMNEINIMESSAKSQSATLILETTDLKTIFSKIGKWIVDQFNKFIKWIHDIVERITSLFKKKDKIENFEEKREEIKDQEIVDIDTDKISQMAQDIQNDFDKRVQDIESASTEEELSKIESDIKSGPNGEELTKSIEEELGLNNKTTVGEKYKSEEDLETNEAQVKDVINNVTKAATSVKDKSVKSLDKKASDVAKDKEFNEAKIEIMKARLYSSAANEALVKATAASKAVLIDENQKKKIIDQLNTIKEYDKLYEKRLEFFRECKPIKDNSSSKKLDNVIGRINIRKDSSSDDEVMNTAYYYIYKEITVEIKSLIIKIKKVKNFDKNDKMILSKGKGMIELLLKLAKDYIPLEAKDKYGKPYWENKLKIDINKVDDDNYYDKIIDNFLKDDIDFEWRTRAFPTDVNWIYDFIEFVYIGCYRNTKGSYSYASNSINNN